MNVKLIIVVVSLCIILAVSIYFLFLNISQLNWTIVPSVLGILAPGFVLFNQINSILTERRKKVVLAYDILLKSNIYQGPWGYQRFTNSYYLRIKKTKGEDIAEDVRGYITVEGTEIQKIPIKWYMEKSASTYIDDYKDLWLFSFENFKNINSDIWFIHASDQIKYEAITKLLKDIKDKKLIVKIEGKNTRVPKNPYSETVENIMSKAVNMS